MKTLTILAASLVAASAYATQEHEPAQPAIPTVRPAIPAHPVHGRRVPGTQPRLDQTPTAAPNTSNTNTNTNSNTSTSIATAYGGQGGAGGSVSGAGNAYVNSERSAPTVAMGAPYQPITSCRLGFSLGGSNTSGGIGLGLPMGSDQTCLAGAKLTMMERVGGFSQESKRAVICKVEGMDELAECKPPAQAAQTQGPVTSSADPYIARRLAGQ